MLECWEKAFVAKCLSVRTMREVYVRFIIEKSDPQSCFLRTLCGWLWCSHISRASVTMPKETRLGSAFKGMLSTCPGEVSDFDNSYSFKLFYVWNFAFQNIFQISSYAKCLTLNADGVEKGVCEKEFLALKSCFRKVSYVHSLSRTFFVNAKRFSPSLVRRSSQ